MEKNSKIIIVVIIAAIGIAVFFYLQKKDTTTPPITPPSTPTTPPITPPIVPPAPKDILTYVRDNADPAFQMLTQYQLVSSADSFVNSMYLSGYSNDYISFAAAFLKGMDLALTVEMVKKYRKQISEFKTKATIDRLPNFYDEVLQQKYDVGSLIKEKPTLNGLRLKF